MIVNGDGQATERVGLLSRQESTDFSPAPSVVLHRQGSSLSVESSPSKRDADAADVESQSPSASAPLAPAAGTGVWRILAESRPEFVALAAGTALTLLSSATTMILPAFAGKLTDEVVAHLGKRNASPDSSPDPAAGVDAGMGAINRYALLIVAAVLVGAVATSARAYLFGAAAERTVSRLRTRLFGALLAQEVAFFDAQRTGELLNRLAEDTTLLRDAATTSLSLALTAAAQCVAGLCFMAAASWKLTAVAALSLPVMLLAVRQYGSWIKALRKQTQEVSAAATAVAGDALGAVRTVKAFGREHDVGQKYDGAVGTALGLGIRAAAAGAAFSGAFFLLSTLAIVATFWYGSRLTLGGEITPGGLSAFMLYAIMTGAGAGMLAGVFASLASAVGASSRVFELVDRIPALKPCGAQRPASSPLGGEMALRGVSFCYPSRPDAPVLADFSLEFPTGSRTALVGASGGGKSTVIALLVRFYDPSHGTVSLDGVALPEIEASWRHSALALVSQEPALFATSIADNIAFGAPAGGPVPGRAAVVAAAKAANAHDFISALPEGYDTLVGERGVRLSGGQRQRVAIARAVLAQPRVLLLDEATSALDAESEACVQEALERLASGRTVIVVAHRLSTVARCSRVAVVAGGAVAELGTPTELLAAGGLYATLARHSHFLGGGAGEGGRAAAALPEVMM